MNKRIRKKQLRRTAGRRYGEEISIKVDGQTFARAVVSAIRDSREASQLYADVKQPEDS